MTNLANRNPAELVDVGISQLRDRLADRLESVRADLVGQIRDTEERLKLTLESLPRLPDLISRATGLYVVDRDLSSQELASPIRLDFTYTGGTVAIKPHPDADDDSRLRRRFRIVLALVPLDPPAKADGP